MDYNQIEAKRAALNELKIEKFKSEVQRQKRMILWPWYKKLFPYKIKITIIDLRKESI